MSGAAIVARGLEKRFGRTIALNGIELDVPPGGVLAVLGENGAGKSTLLRLMAGLARPTAGSLEIGGERCHRRAARGRIGLVADGTYLYPELTARENLVFTGRLHGVAEPGARADALLEEVDLTPVGDRRAGAFSRGMAQRLAIARALVHDPDVVLLDEPFIALDRRSADRLAARLRALRTAGRTLVLVTHDVARAAGLASAAIVLARGRIAHTAHDGAGDGGLDAERLEEACARAADGAP